MNFISCPTPVEGDSTCGGPHPQWMALGQAQRPAWGSGARSTGITKQLWASPPQNQVASSRQTGRHAFPTTVKRSASETPEALWESCFLSRPHWGTGWGPLCNLKKPHLPADALSLAHLSQAAWGDGHFLGPYQSWVHACAIHRHQIQGSLKSTLSLKFSDVAVNQNHVGCWFNRQKLWVPPDIVIENQQLPVCVCSVMSDSLQPHGL